MTKRHTKLPGFEVCIHTCQIGRCHGLRYNESVLWKREGHAAASHALRSSVHPNCGPFCPGFPFLDISRAKMPVKNLVRPPNPDEIKRHLLCYPEDAIELKDHDIHDNIIDFSMANLSINDVNTSDSSDGRREPPTTSQNRLGDYIQPNNSTSKDKCFEIVYVPDPTCNTTMSQAADSLSFIKTKITPEEFESIQHLDGSVFKTGRSTTVYMQEWVSIHIMYSQTF